MFGPRFRIVTILGFPIHIDLSWFVIVALIAWSLAAGAFPQFYPDLSTQAYWWMGVAGAIGLFVCVLLHELGHAVVARRFNVEMRGITLFIFGGVAEMGGEPPHAKAEFFTAIGGPVVTLVLAAIFYAFTFVPLPAPVAGVNNYLLLINVVLLAFNAVPAFPLDGGRVLRAAMWHVKGSLRWATRWSSQIGSGFGAALIVLAVFMLFIGNFIGAMWWFLIGMFLRNAAAMSYRQVLIRQMLGGEPVRRFMTDDPVTVGPETTIDQFVEDYVYQHHFKMFPVVRDGHLAGCITTRQVKQIPRDQWSQRTVADVAEACSTDNIVHPDDDAMEAMNTLSRAGRSRAMVVDNSRLVGVLSLKDLMNFLALKLELETAGGDDGVKRLPLMRQTA